MKLMEATHYGVALLIGIWFGLWWGAALVTKDQWSSGRLPQVACGLEAILDQDHWHTDVDEPRGWVVDCTAGAAGVDVGRLVIIPGR